MPKTITSSFQKITTPRENRYQKRRDNDYRKQQKSLKTLGSQAEALSFDIPTQTSRISSRHHNQHATHPLVIAKPEYHTTPYLNTTLDNVENYSTTPHALQPWQVYLLLTGALLNVPVTRAQLEHTQTEQKSIPKHNRNDSTHSASLSHNESAHLSRAVRSVLEHSDFLHHSYTNRRAHPVSDHAKLVPKEAFTLYDDNNQLNDYDELTDITTSSASTSTQTICQAAMRQAYQRAEQLSQWVNTTQLQNKIHRPLDALGAVSHHYQQTFSEDFFISLDICHLTHTEQQLLDEAAQLYRIAQLSNSGEPPINLTALDQLDTPIDTLNLREDFVQALRKDIHRETMLAQLFTPAINGTHTQIFFDGVALHNAFGKRFDDLLTLPELKHIPGFANLSIEAQRALVKEKFTQMGESTLYTFGTVEQSLASTIMRLSIYQHQPIPNTLANPETLFEIFHQLEQTWSKQRNYPLHPRVLFAQHLASSSNAHILNSNWQEQFWNNTYRSHLKNLLDQNKICAPEFNRAQTWIDEYFSYWNRNGQTWNQRDQTIKNEIFSSLFSQLETFAQTYHPKLNATQLQEHFANNKHHEENAQGYQTRTEKIQAKEKTLRNLRANSKKLMDFPPGLLRSSANSRMRQAITKAEQELNQLKHDLKAGRMPSLPTGEPPKPIILLAKYMYQENPSGEILLADHPHDKIAALIKYSGERLTARYSAPPRFDRKKAAYDILLRHGISTIRINEKRRYTLDTSRANYGKSSFGSLIDEFLERADWPSLLGAGKTMSVKDQHGKLQHIHTQSTLQAEEDQWNQQLPSHPWIQARARENCRSTQQPLSQANINKEVQHLIRNFATETESYRHLKQGLETLINTVPVIGPIYNIEEGIRHKDVAQTISGVFFLGLDGLDLLSGGKHIRSNKVHIGEELSTKIKVPHTEQITVQTVHGITDELDIELAAPSTSHDTQNIYLDHDPWRITATDINVPFEYKSLAKRVRDGQPNIIWTAPTKEDYRVVLIDNENRVAPVMQSGGKYYEVSWHDGLVLRNRLIHFDTASKKFTRGLGLKGSGRVSGNALIDNEKLRDRYTIKRVEALLHHAKNTALRNNLVQDFAQHFQISAVGGMSNFDVQTFFIEAYEKSVTFRRIANHFFEKHNKVWKIGIWDQWNDLKIINHESTVQIPSDARINTLRYLSMTGWQPCVPKQIYLDSLIGSLSKTELTNILNARGPVVALRDRVLFEMGEDIPVQLTHERVRLDKIDSPEYAELTAENKKAKVTDAQWLEDIYLDHKYFNNYLTPTANTIVLGTRLDERFTVQSMKALKKEALVLKANDLDIDMDNFHEVLTNNFVFSSLGDQAANTQRFYKNLFESSPTFRIYWQYAYVKGWLDGKSKWEFINNPDSARAHLPISRQRSAINLLSKTIYTLPDDMHYLSEQGLVHMQDERKLAHQMISILTRTEEPTVNVWTNRGATVHLVEKILRELELNVPRRIGYGLVRGEDIHSARFNDGINPIVYTTSARRALEIEEKFLKSAEFKRSYKS